MPKQITTIQKCAWGFAALFLGVYLLDYVPGIMDANGLMFGLFHMTRIVDLGDVLVYFFSHLGHVSLKTNILVNLPHILIFIAAFWIAAKVNRSIAEA